MKRNILHALSAVALIGSTCAVASLSGCAVPSATSGTVKLDADKALVTAQISFKTLQEVTLAGIQSGAIKGTLKVQVINLIDRGQEYENQAVVAEASGTDIAGAVAGLTNIVAQLNAAGITAKGS